MNRYALCVVNFQAALAETSPHLLVVRSTKVPAASISASKDLELVVRAGEGVDNIDLAAAAIAKVEVANRAGADADAVAELAMGLILDTLLRKMPAAAAACKLTTSCEPLARRRAGRAGLSSYSYICVLILLYMCPQLLYIRPHTTTCVLMLLQLESRRCWQPVKRPASL